MGELGLDGVFAYNDEYAMLLMRALQDAGVRIPGDTAVIGADDLLIGRLLRPRLSTVRIEMPTGSGWRGWWTRPCGILRRSPSGMT